MKGRIIKALEAAAGEAPEILSIDADKYKIFYRAKSEPDKIKVIDYAENGKLTGLMAQLQNATGAVKILMIDLSNPEKVKYRVEFHKKDPINGTI